MRYLLILNLLVTLVLLIRFVRASRPIRTKTFYLGLVSASVANFALLIWFGMWYRSPPEFPAEYWKFIGCAAISAIAALVSFVSGWFAREQERIFSVLTGLALGILSILVGTASIRVS